MNRRVNVIQEVKLEIEIVIFEIVFGMNAPWMTRQRIPIKNLPYISSHYSSPKLEWTLDLVHKLVMLKQASLHIFLGFSPDFNHFKHACQKNNETALRVNKVEIMVDTMQNFFHQQIWESAICHC